MGGHQHPNSSPLRPFCSAPSRISRASIFDPLSVFSDRAVPSFSERAHHTRAATCRHKACVAAHPFATGLSTLFAVWESASRSARHRCALSFRLHSGIGDLRLRVGLRHRIVRERDRHDGEDREETWVPCDARFYRLLHRLFSTIACDRRVCGAQRTSVRSRAPAVSVIQPDINFESELVPPDGRQFAAKPSSLYLTRVPDVNHKCRWNRSGYNWPDK